VLSLKVLGHRVYLYLLCNTGTKRHYVIIRIRMVYDLQLFQHYCNKHNFVNDLVVKRRNFDFEFTKGLSNFKLNKTRFMLPLRRTIAHHRLLPYLHSDPTDDITGHFYGRNIDYIG